MGLSITFVSGLRRSGKTALIRAMTDRLYKVPPHYIRLVHADDEASCGAGDAALLRDQFASACSVSFDEARVFEVLPDALTTIHNHDRTGCVVIEADADPILRHAYTYDNRVFVMPAPANVAEVFREPANAAGELQRVLDDTAYFASEIFGLFDGADDGEPHEDRPDMSANQMRGFLSSPLGDELATRIQLEPAFHGLVESDVIVVNTQAGAPEPESTACLYRLDRLLDRIACKPDRKGNLFLWDPDNPKDAATKRLFKALKPLCRNNR